MGVTMGRPPANPYILEEVVDGVAPVMDGTQFWPRFMAQIRETLPMRRSDLVVWTLATIINNLHVWPMKHGQPLSVWQLARFLRKLALMQRATVGEWEWWLPLLFHGPLLVNAWHNLGNLSLHPEDALGQLGVILLHNQVSHLRGLTRTLSWEWCPVRGTMVWLPVATRIFMLGPC